MLDEGTVPERLAEQAGYCRDLGSPLYAALLERAAGDAGRGGVVAEVVAPVAGPYGSMLALRLMAAVHRLVLEGVAPDLAAHYPSAGGGGSSPPCTCAISTLRPSRRSTRVRRSYPAPGATLRPSTRPPRTGASRC